MGQYQYKLEPKTYKIMARVIDEFYEEMTQHKLNPTLVRLENYIDKVFYKSKYQTEFTPHVPEDNLP